MLSIEFLCAGESIDDGVLSPLSPIKVKVFIWLFILDIPPPTLVKKSTNHKGVVSSSYFKRILEVTAIRIVLRHLYLNIVGCIDHIPDKLVHSLFYFDGFLFILE